MNNETEKSLFEATYNPDVLLCLANLSNDEVFTPPEVANQMIDMLPQELFEDPNTTFLDPCCKSGVFLREIAKRLIKGLEDKIPDLQERIDHIMHKQLYGIAITELTSLLSRRSLYCSKYPNSKYSISKFDDIEGNIRFKRITHTWQDKKCIYCGASKDQYDRDLDLEMHAYELIHTLKPEEVFNMKFDVIISNPPYQLNDGGGMGTSSIPLYNKFIEQAKKMNPKYLSMIIPARWYSGGKGLDEFRNEMLQEDSLRYLVDYFNAEDCFPGIDISGGVCYFLWERDYHGPCTIKNNINEKETEMNRPLLENNADTFIRFNDSVSIFRKIQSQNEETFEKLVSARKPFGLTPKINVYDNCNGEHDIKVYAWPENGYIKLEDVKQNQDKVNKYKILIAKAYGERGQFPYLVLSKPFIAEPNSCCTETYLMIDCDDDFTKAQNIISYMNTKFFRFVVLFKKNTQNAPKGVYSYVPMQNFNEVWTDEKLYKKYNLTSTEIQYIESMVRNRDLED